jgi:hypothetical protein
MSYSPPPLMAAAARGKVYLQHEDSFVSISTEGSARLVDSRALATVFTLQPASQQSSIDSTAACARVHILASPSGKFCGTLFSPDDYRPFACNLNQAPLENPGYVFDISGRGVRLDASSAGGSLVPGGERQWAEYGWLHVG